MHLTAKSSQQDANQQADQHAVEQLFTHGQFEAIKCCRSDVMPSALSKRG